MKKLYRGVLKAVGLSLALGCFTSPLGYAVPPAEALAELPRTFDADISPYGKHLAVICVEKFLVEVNGPSEYMTR